MQATRLRVRCPGDVSGREVAIRYPVANPAITTLIDFTAVDGARETAVLPPDVMSWMIPTRINSWQVALTYLRLGIEHIWSGLDHLLFIVGLVLLARNWRRILVTLTGFTLAHSITLCLATLDVVRVAIPPVEAAIALSILFLARELVIPREDTLSKCYPVIVASSFGLLHGFGFASVLGEIGLPKSQLAVSLLFFNLGVEAGQVAFVVLLFLAAWCLSRAVGFARAEGLSLPDAHRQRLFLAHGLGAISAYWFVDRSIIMLAG